MKYLHYFVSLLLRCLSRSPIDLARNNAETAIDRALERLFVPRVMATFLALLLLLINSNGVVQGQKLNNKLPSVYLSFKEYLNDNEGKQMVRLTLRNNTK